MTSTHNKNCSCSKENCALYFSANDLTDRWHCARSSVDRITRRAGMKRLCLGEGKNGMVRFLRKEVEAYEQKQLI